MKWLNPGLIRDPVPDRSILESWLFWPSSVPVQETLFICWRLTRRPRRPSPPRGRMENCRSSPSPRGPKGGRRGAARRQLLPPTTAAQTQPEKTAATSLPSRRPSPPGVLLFTHHLLQGAKKTSECAAPPKLFHCNTGTPHAQTRSWRELTRPWWLGGVRINVLTSLEHYRLGPDRRCIRFPRGHSRSWQLASTSPETQRSVGSGKHLIRDPGNPCCFVWHECSLSVPGRKHYRVNALSVLFCSYLTNILWNKTYILLCMWAYSCMLRVSTQIIWTQQLDWIQALWFGQCCT